MLCSVDATGAIRTRAQKEVSDICRQEPLRSGVYGVLAVRMNGDTLVSINPGQKMVPASTAKLVTTGVALKTLGVVFPFLIAAILKSAQGSSTVAITTTASMMGMFNDSGSMMSALGFTSPLAAALVVMAIGAGAMTVSHANDSYFWVVTGFGGIKARDGYRTMTLMTLIMGLTAILLIALAAAILL
jgi:GntP family gluconate:H+ symporter